MDDRKRTLAAITVIIGFLVLVAMIVESRKRQQSAFSGARRRQRDKNHFRISISQRYRNFPSVFDYGDFVPYEDSGTSVPQASPQATAKPTPTAKATATNTPTPTTKQ